MTDGSAVGTAWRSHEIQICLPIGLVRAMFDRARKWRREKGGRFDPRVASIVLWSGPTCSDNSRPMGSFSVRWRHPTEDKATIYLICWDESQGGSIGEVCRAVEVLAGSLVAR